MQIMTSHLKNRLRKLELKVMSEELPGYSKKEVKVLKGAYAGKLDALAFSDALITKMSKDIVAKLDEAAADPNYDETELYLWLAQQPFMQHCLRASPAWMQFVREHWPDWESSTPAL